MSGGNFLHLRLLCELLRGQDLGRLPPGEWPDLGEAIPKYLDRVAGEVRGGADVFRQWHRPVLVATAAAGTASRADLRLRLGLGREVATDGRRQVFLPGSDQPRHRSARSRVAETVRLLGRNREPLGLEPSTAHLGYHLQERLRPARDRRRVADAVARLTGLVGEGAFPDARRPDLLRQAIEVAGTALGYPTFAEFQERSWEAVLRSLFGGPDRPLVTMVTAGVSSGKTFGFLLPALTLLVYRALCGEGGVVRVLIVYPRTSLVEDQFNELARESADNPGLLTRANAVLARRFPGRALTPHPGLDAASLLGPSIGATGSLAEVLPEVARRRVELVLTTPESLKNRMVDPRAVRTY
jgi:hypothetical protein